MGKKKVVELMTGELTASSPTGVAFLANRFIFRQTCWAKEGEKGAATLTDQPTLAKGEESSFYKRRK